MKKHLVALMLMGGMASADVVSYRWDVVQIKFDEPVVPQSACQNGGNPEASAADKGLDLFDVTGDDQHKPHAYWEDQDRLIIEFAEGTSCATEYRLSFRPGCGKYLGQAPMPETSFTFRHPRTSLDSFEVPGLDEGAVVVFPRKNKTKEEQNFSPESGQEFFYQEIINEEHQDGNGRLRTERKKGATIPASVQAARLKHGFPPNSLSRMAKASPDWASLTPESPLPGAVLVQPQSPLPEGSNWELVCNESVGFRRNDIHYIESVHHGLSTYATVGYDSPSGELQVDVFFAAPVPEEEAKRAWRDMELSIGETKAVATADPMVKALTLNGQEYRFRLQEIIPGKTQHLSHYRSHGTDAPDLPMEYKPQGEATGLAIKVEGGTPFVLDLVVPQGIATTLGGRQTLSPQRHRLSLNPVWPRLGQADTRLYAKRGDCSLRTALLPWKGEHKLRLPVVNATGLQVTAYRIPGDILATQADEIEAALNRETLVPQIVSLQVCLEQYNHGVRDMERKELERLQTQLKHLLARRNGRGNPAILNKLTAHPTQVIPVPQGDNTNLVSAEAVLDMDTLLGREAKPGVYLLHMVSQANPAVRKTLADLKLPEDLLDMEQYALVQLTDLNVAYDDDNTLVLAYRLSDGTPVADAKATPYVAVEKKRFMRNNVVVMRRQGEASPMQNGCADVVELIGKGEGKHCVLVESGEDYMVVGAGYNIWEKAEPKNKCLATLQTDRKLYRPGETVHVRGILRSVTPQGEASIPRNVTSVKFRVRKPDGKDLLNKQVQPDESGGIDELFVLPEGEEDVTGRYEIEMSALGMSYLHRTDVQVEVFRRDSFKTASQLTVAPIAPKEFTYTLEAVDLNGTPVSNGKATVEITSTVPFTLAADTHAAPVKKLDREFKLDAQGKVEIKGRLTALKPQETGWLHISGSVANDREEHVRLAYSSERFHPADFTPDFNAESGLIFLKNSTESGETLARAQKVHVALHYIAMETKALPNGFVFGSTKPAILKEEDIVVPADCRAGVPWNAKAMWQEFADAHPDTVAQDTPRVVITGTDPEGRTVEDDFNLRPWSFAKEQPDKVATAGRDDCTFGEDGKLHFTANFLRGGTASVIVAGRDNIQAFQLDVQAGKQEITLEAPHGVEGEALVLAYLPHPDSNGVFTRYEIHKDTCEIPYSLHALQTQLNVPEKTVLPGSKIRIDGQVTKDGKGVPATVTLYAVDEGMLTLSHYSVPDLVTYFCGDSGCYIELGTVVRSNAQSRSTRKGGTYSMIPGIWGRDSAHPVYGMALRNGARALSCAGKAKGFLCRADGDGDDDAMETCDMEPAVPVMAVCEESGASDDEGTSPAPRLRVNFQPVALWQGALKTDAEGRFSTEVELPDTLTTYKVYALVLGDDGSTFGNAEAGFTVNQPLMLTPGTPLFMSTGDTLRLPLTVTNNTDTDGTWEITLSSATGAQKVSIPAHGSATVYFDFTATEEGDSTLEWTAKGEGAADAVQGSFPVRFPAPLLKEAHHLVIPNGQEKKLAELLAPELATSTRGTAELHMSANPLLHLVGNMDYLLDYPYGCTEQTASALLPWLFYNRMAPLSPMLADTPADKVHEVIAKSIETLFKRQTADGGLSYWGSQEKSCGWASACAALVFTIAQEQGHGGLIPTGKMKALQDYLRGYLAELKKDGERWDATSPMILFALGRVLGEGALIDEALNLAEQQNKDADGWFWHRDIGADLTFIRALRGTPGQKHEAFLQWMRARGHDYRHTTTLRSGWMLIALHEYLRNTPESSTEATVQLQDGTTMVLNQGVTTLKLQAKPLSELPTALKAVEGEVYATFKVKAQPNCTEYPGVVEKGLQITRIYEKKGADGIWREAKDFHTGDVVRVTLTCAKSAHELEYFVLEDYLPSCMEAINPNVPSQAAGLEWTPWSHWFDHKEYLADRVRGFCTRWGGRDLLNMTYYARVKRAGTTTAPPAQAQLMYEPQTYGLSPNARIQSK